ncbi:MAG: HD domain-containing protein [Candidatus Omnitrophica bacterium]|jgi:putative hydrolase of HD superfamily|nr:HD domain-containing protein [Candidatus Omnitrophota bacterium]
MGDTKTTLDFFAELGMLKRVKRSGWWMLGIPEEESVAEHSFRCAAIGYVLAKMEKADPYKVVMMSLFNDIHEARINDLHKVAHRYLNVREAEKEAFAGQIDGLDTMLKNDLKTFRSEHDAQRTKESLVARDADILECLVQAKEYADLGYKSAKKFFRKAPSHLKTKSAKKLWNDTSSWDSSTWWEKLSKFER